MSAAIDASSPQLSVQGGVRSAAWCQIRERGAEQRSQERDRPEQRVDEREPQCVRGSPASESRVHLWNGGVGTSAGQFCGAHSLTTQPDAVARDLRVDDVQRRREAGVVAGAAGLL